MPPRNSRSKKRTAPEPVEVALSTGDGFAYYELTAEQAKEYEEGGRDSTYVLLNGKQTRRVAVAPRTEKEL